MNEVVALLRELVGLQRETLAVLRRQAAAEPLADRFTQEARRLLGDEPFTATSILALANSRLSTRLELRAVAEEIVRGSLDDPGAGRKFGRFLAQNSQHEVAGLRLVSLGKARDGYSYRVEVATETRNRWNFG
jgi:hypothetical protein